MVKQQKSGMKVYRPEKPGVLDSLKMNLLKSFIPSIRENIKKIDPVIASQLATVELREGETSAAYLITIGSDDVVYMLTCAFDDNDKVVRIVDEQPVTDFLENILNTL